MRILDYNFIDGNINGLKEAKNSTNTELYNKLSALETNNFKAKINEITKSINENVFTAYTSFKFVQKGFGNADLSNFEVGDVFEGWSNDGKWLGHCNYNGGGVTSSVNFTPIQNQIHISASTTILPSWHGAIVIITAAGVVLTVPADLPVISFDAITRPSATCNFALTPPKTWVNGTPTLVPEKSTFVFVVDSLNSNEIYVSKKSATQVSDFEIIDPIPSIVVDYLKPTLIKEYNLGVLANKKMIDFTFLFHKIGTANENIQCNIYLVDTISNDSLLIGNNANNGFQKGMGIQRYCTLQNNIITVTPINSVGSGTQLGNVTENVEEFVIDSLNSFKLQVFLNNGWYSGSRQYFGKINLK